VFTVSLRFPVHESELHNRIYARSADLAHAYPSILTGPGDDCAVIKAPRGDQLLLKVDQLVERRHFTPDTPIDLIARKSIARPISDIAAMAGTPTHGLAAGVLPLNYPHSDELCQRLAHWARQFGAPLVGGDIAAGPPGAPLTLSITILGIPHPASGPVLRSTAKPGDELWITGRIGNSLANNHHLTFEPRLAEAKLLASTLGDNLRAMIDISDGLGRDAGRIAAASKVRILIDADKIPLAPGATNPRQAAADGEDYELLFTTAPNTFKPPANSPTPFTRIGRVLEGAGCTLALPTGEQIDASTMGWDH
jgi:thiamine-monophosphate kinase